ncbi:MAG TPA: hypothetical protein VEH78_04560 [Pseudolabrys sp.]|nr:hypothetical protein [Pseudolabrys sp.]
MIESKHSPACHRPVRENIEEERERDKRHEDQVVTSSDDSFPASDPPSFTGMITAAGEEAEKGQINAI